jgi:hypothetical protein
MTRYGFWVVLTVLAVLLVAHVVAAFRGGTGVDAGDAGDAGEFPAGSAPPFRPRGETQPGAPAPGGHTGG